MIALGGIAFAGGTVILAALEQGRTKVRFTLAKSAERDDRDTRLQGKARWGRAFAELPFAAGTPYEPTDAVLEQLRAIAPGWDRQALLARYREWSRGKTPPDTPHGAFVGWVRRFVPFPVSPRPSRRLSATDKGAPAPNVHVLTSKRKGLRVLPQKSYPPNPRAPIGPA